MLGFLTRQYSVPSRLLLAIPIFVGIWAAFEVYPILDHHQRFGQSTSARDLYWNIVGNVFAGKYLIAAAACVILRYARVSVLGAILLFLVLAGLSTTLVHVVLQPIFSYVALIMLGTILGLANSPRGGQGLAPFLLLLGGGTVLLVTAMLAVSFRLTTQALAGGRVRWRPLTKSLGIHVCIALIALILVVGATVVLLSMGLDQDRSGFVVLAVAIIVFLAIGIVHWGLGRRALRASAEADEPRVRLWLCAGIVAAFVIWAPHLLLGVWGGAYLHITIIRPPLRAIYILPTPKLEIGSVRIDLPYREPGFSGVLAQGPRERIGINSQAHPYRLPAHPNVSIAIHVLARDALMRGSDHNIETDLTRLLRDGGPDASAKPVTLRYDFSDTRRYRAIVRYIPDHSDVVFRVLARSRDVSFEELEIVMDQFIAERVRRSQGSGGSPAR
jgi:hypothetical protein